MYNSFFGLDAAPFRVNPDPRFLYFSESHREGLAKLLYATRDRKGFIVLTGEVGTGKTTLLNALLDKLEPKIKAAYIFNTSLGVEDFFATLFEELEIDFEYLGRFPKGAALQVLNRYLIDRFQDGLQTMVVIDEAQNLSPELLEEIRMLSNLETPRSKLLQLVLVGQPELASRLARTDLRQLRQRVEFFHRIRPLNERETAAYVRKRLLIAGHETGEIFTRRALRAVYRHSRGIPRVINVICDNALLTAYARESTRVLPRMVHEAAADGLLAAEPDPAARSPRRRLFGRREADRGMA